MSEDSTTHAQGIALVALSATAYGFMPLFAKMAYAAGTSTHTLLFLRFLTATVFMFALMRTRHLPFPPLRETCIYLLVGAVIYVGQSLAYFMALNYAPTGVVALLLYTYPIIVVAGSALIFRECIGRRTLAALALAVIGAFTIVDGELGGSPTGIALACVSAVVYAAYILVTARVVHEGTATQSSALIMAGATVVYGFMALIFGFQPPREPVGWLAIVLIALVSTVVAFWAFLAGVEHTGPATAALVSTLEPVVAVLTSTIFLSEPLTHAIAVGGLLILAALVVTSLPTGDTANESGGQIRS